MAADLTVRAVRRRSFVPATLAITVVALQIAYPLVHGGVRDHLTVAIVTLFAAAGLAHAWVTRGLRVAVTALGLTAVPGFAAEVLGVHTGFPFGSYAYDGSLGPRWFGVPLVVALAWTMLAWPAAIAARRLVRGFGARMAVGAWALAAGDLFLDPQLVAAGHWTWRHPSPHLPGVATVPLTNYAGWLLVALVLSLGLQLLLRGPEHDERVPLALYLWLYVGWIVALAAFLHLGAAAAWGALGMGAVALPLAGRLRR
jgi:uncharacterized membrane protein